MPTISISRVQPFVTRSTALLTSPRASPCTAACESFSRIASRGPSFCSTFIPRGRVVSRLPSIPCTAISMTSFFPSSFVIGDVPFFFQDASNLQLQLGSRNIHFLVPGGSRIADSRQHVCDRIGQPHRLLLLKLARSLRRKRRTRGSLPMSRWSLVVRTQRLSSYQLDFETPGISPRSASPRKHKQQMPNLRR